MLPSQEPAISPFTRSRGPTRVLTVLALWFFIGMALGLSGWLGGAAGARRPPMGLALAMGIPVLAFVVDGWFGAPLFGPVRELRLNTLIAIQTCRIVGASFLVASWAQNALPAAFALPAGLGDVVIGLTAPFVAGAVGRRARGYKPLAVVWNLAGLADLIDALFLGLTHTSSPLGIFATYPTTDALARYPFNLITTFVVPIAMVLHVLALRHLAWRSPRSDPRSSAEDKPPFVAMEA